MQKTLYDYIKNREKFNILLLSDGGTGKTFQMIYAFKKFLTEHNSGKNIPIHIDVKQLDYDSRNPIFKYVAETYLGKYKNHENLDVILSKSLYFDLNKKNRYIFFIDGLNETVNKANILNDINKIKHYSACSMVVSSRVEEDSYVFEKFEKIRLKKIEHKKVVETIKSEYKINDELCPEQFEDELLEILEYPLFLNVFCKAYDKDGVFECIQNKKHIRKTDIISAYIQKILQEIKSRKVVDENELIEFAAKFFLPRLAFLMVKNDMFMISHRELISLLDESEQENLGVKYFTFLLNGEKSRKLVPKYRENLFHIIEYCLNLSLLKYNEHSDTYEFLHHIWRDYFASQHIVNLLGTNQFEELLFFPREIMIRSFVGEMYKRNSRCEHDYINKTNCSSEQSPIEFYMQTNCIELNRYPKVIASLIDVMKVARDNKITASYNNLNLELVSFVGCKLPNSSFDNSKIYESNFYAQGHSGYVYAATITPDNNRIISCGKDSTIRIWDVLTQRQIGEPLRGHNNYVVSVKTINGGQEIISCSYDGTIRRWSAETHKQIGNPLLGHTKRINQIAVTSDEKYVVSCSSDATIRIWCLHSGVQDGEALCGHNGVVNGICILPDERYIVSAGEDGTVRLWDFVTHKQSGSPLLGHNCSVKSVCVTSDGKCVISADQKGKVCIWDIESREQIGSTLQCSNDSIETIAALPDNSTIVTAGYDGKIRLFDISKRILIGQVEAHGDWINGVSISNDGNFLVSAGGDQAIKLWDTKTLELVGKPFVGTDSWINSVKITSDSQFIISAGDDAAIRIWSVPQKRMVCEPRYGHTARINEIDISADGIIVSASDDGKVGMWNINNKSETTLLNGHSSWVRTVILSENGEYAISGGWDRDIIKWDLKHGEIVKKLPGHNASVEALALVNDDGLLISGSDDETIRFWDVKKGDQCEDPIEAHDDWIRALKLTHDKKRIVTASWDNTIRIWDVDSHEMVGEPLKGHNNRIDALDVSKDGIIISGSDDNTVRAWEKNNGIYAATIIANHSNAVSGVSISDDSKFVVSGDGSGIIKISYLDREESNDVIRQLRLNVFNSNLTNISEDSDVSKEFLYVLYQNGCEV